MPLIVIEGLDGSGKATNAALLRDRLEACGKAARKISFPDYESDSSALVKMYLSGRFGDSPDSVNAYAASAFYAVDRYAGFKLDWGAALADGAWVIADRYTTSNAVHQCSKLPPDRWDGYLDWLYDFEFEKLGLPKPDAVIYIDIPREISEKLLENRYGGDEGKKDIHEKDAGYLEKSRAAALYAAKKLGWRVFRPACGGAMPPREQVAERIFEIIKEIYGDKL